MLPYKQRIQKVHSSVTLQNFQMAPFRQNNYCLLHIVSHFVPCCNLIIPVDDNKICLSSFLDTVIPF